MEVFVKEVKFFRRGKMLAPQFREKVSLVETRTYMAITEKSFSILIVRN